jgi:hypothetical protein
MCAIIGLLPNERVGVYVLENLDHAELRHGLMYSALDLFNGGATRDWSADLHALFASAASAAGGAGAGPTRHADAKPSLPLDRYAGTYVDSTYGEVRITLQNGALQAQIVTEPAAALEPWEYETFRTTGNPARPSVVTFVPDGAGNVTGVRVSGVTFTRVRTNRRG